jgi:hypothetical protein
MEFCVQTSDTSSENSSVLALSRSLHKIIADIDNERQLRPTSCIDPLTLEGKSLYEACLAVVSHTSNRDVPLDLVWSLVCFLAQVFGGLCTLDLRHVCICVMH